MTFEKLDIYFVNIWILRGHTLIPVFGGNEFSPKLIKVKYHLFSHNKMLVNPMK